jgi:hypothetical protein
MLEIALISQMADAAKIILFCHKLINIVRLSEKYSSIQQGFSLDKVWGQQST